jgi:hypothetical protein
MTASTSSIRCSSVADEPAPLGLLPQHLDVRRQSGDQHDVVRTIAHDLIRDGDAMAVGVPGDGHVGPTDVGTPLGGEHRGQLAP